MLFTEVRYLYYVARATLVCPDECSVHNDPGVCTDDMVKYMCRADIHQQVQESGPHNCNFVVDTVPAADDPDTYKAPSFAW